MRRAAPTLSVTAPPRLPTLTHDRRCHDAENDRYVRSAHQEGSGTRVTTRAHETLEADGHHQVAAAVQDRGRPHRSAPAPQPTITNSRSTDSGSHNSIATTASLAVPPDPKYPTQGSGQCHTPQIRPVANVVATGRPAPTGHAGRRSSRIPLPRRSAQPPPAPPARTPRTADRPAELPRGDVPHPSGRANADAVARIPIGSSAAIT